MWAEKHIEECSEKFNPEDNGRTYVVCAICGYHGKSLGKHISDVHGIAPREYEKKYEVMISCSAARKNYSEQNKYNCDWIKRAKENGDDLVEYRQKMGSAVSKAILANPSALKIRSETMSKLNKTDEFRKRASRTAKITSARQDIIEQRTHRLINSFKPTRPERQLINIMNEKYPGYHFRFNYVLQDKSHFTLNKSGRKQIDLTSFDQKIMIEFDGGHHFHDSWKRENFECIQGKDIQLDQYVKIHNEWMLIRISFDCFQYERETKSKGVIKDHFKIDALQKLFDLLSNPQPGVHCIGDSYGERNLLNANSKNFNNSVCL